MNDYILKEYSDATLSKNDFERLSKYIYDVCGIKMLPVKKIMLETRLKKRLKACGINSFTEYCDHVFNNKNGNNEELVQMIDVVTTNKTDFFREPAQFNYLNQQALHYLLSKHDAGKSKKLNVWCAGCSTGEEPYTLAMVLKEFGEQIPDYNFSIFATDISTKVLREAEMGIYDYNRIAPVPDYLKKKYFLRGKDSKKDLVRVVPELRNKVNFKRLNFMDDDFGIAERQHIIFCRNVIIYFDKTTQEKLIKKLFANIIPGGFLFLGHSETIFRMDLSMVQVAPSTYKKIK